MESRSHAMLAGVFLLVLIAGVVGALFFFVGGRSERVHYEIVSHLSVPGLMVEAPVRLRGVDVGSVEAIRFDPKDPRAILVTVGVEKGTPMTRGVYAQLELWGISGLRYVSLNDDGADPTPLAPGGRIEMQPSFIGKAATSVEALLDDAHIAVQRITAILSEENVERLSRTLAKLERTIDGVGDATRSVQTDVTRGTLPKLDTLLDLLANDARKFDQLLTSLNEQPQSLIFGRPARRPGPGEPGFKDRQERKGPR